MTKSRIAAAALAALTLAGAMTAASSQANAGGHGWGYAGAGFAAGALIGAAVAANAQPAYVVAPGYYRSCQWTTRYDAWGYAHNVKVCETVPY